MLKSVWMPRSTTSNLFEKIRAVVWIMRTEFMEIEYRKAVK